VLCLEQLGEDWQSSPRQRELVPAHAIAAGKVLLAHRPPWRDSVLERPLERLTRRTVVDPEAVRQECERTLDRGYAFDDGEYHDGLQSIAAPVIHVSGDVIVAVGLTGTRQLKVNGHLDAVRDATADLRRKLDDVQLVCT
jgi:DNA-binding IclR family transcriptional regulator